MKKEDLLKLLRDGGLDDEAIKELLKGVLSELGEELKDEGKAREEEKFAEDDEKRQASKLFGVNF